MPKIIGKASREPIREIRRKILLEEIILKQPTKKWSVRSMAEAAREHTWFIETMPTYSKSTAHQDFLAIMADVKERREELAEDYIVNQLTIADDLIQDLLEEYENLNSVDLADIHDPIERANFIVSRAKTKKDIVASIDRLFSRQSDIVPISIPKKMQIDSRSVHINLDTFQKIQGQVEAQKQALLQDTIREELSESNGDYEEGEFEDMED